MMVTRVGEMGAAGGLAFAPDMLTAGAGQGGGDDGEPGGVFGTGGGDWCAATTTEAVRETSSDAGL